MKTAAYLVGCLLLVIACVVISIKQLSEDASPAAAFCLKAERQGVPCEVGPKYEAQIIILTDATGTQSAYLVVSQGTTMVGAIPLQ